MKANEFVVPLGGVDDLDATISSPITVQASPKVPARGEVTRGIVPSEAA